MTECNRLSPLVTRTFGFTKYGRSLIGAEHMRLKYLPFFMFNIPIGVFAMMELKILICEHARDYEQFI